jgi:hypothetical protein
MANPTSNFGWQMPTPTDLVTDLPADFEVFGQAVDTSMADLKGGTTGQILAKNSNTDMDFVWVANDVGDITAVTAGTGITGGGTSGAVTVSFDQANFGGGQFAAGKNKIINGNFSNWQRGTTVGPVISPGFLADRFKCEQVGESATYSQQTFTPGAAPVAGYESQYFARVETTTAAAVGNYSIFDQRIEDVRTFAGQTMTFSFYAKADATKSIAIEVGQVFGSGGSATVFINVGKQALSTSWTRYTFTISIPSISGKTLGAGSYLYFRCWLSAGSNFDVRTGTLGQQSITFDTWGWQTESGSIATPFQTASGGSPQAELAMCQRYYWRVTPGTSGSRISALIGATAATDSYGIVDNPVPMRTTPSSVDFSALNVVNAGTSTFAVTSITNTPSLGTINGSGVGVFVASGLTTGDWHSLQTSSVSGYIGFSAEL